MADFIKLKVIPAFDSSILLKQELPTIDIGDVEELSDFLRSLEEELDFEISFAADQRAPKPKLQNH